jgi:hypothetical protein
LLDPVFYHAMLVQTARSVLATLGVARHVPWTEAAALLMLAVVPLVDLVRSGGWSIGKLLDNKLLISTGLVFAVSLYATLLDWYPFPNEVSYLGSFNYYYHSVIVVLVVVWVAYVIKAGFLRDCSWRHGPVSAAVATVLVVAIIVVNFVIFDRVNRLVLTIHIYPYSSSALFQQLRQKLPLVLDVPRGDGGPIIFTQRPTELEARYREDLHALFGTRWDQNGFYTTFNLIKPNPIMQRPYLDHLLRAFYPFHRFSVHTRAEGS